MTKKAAPKLSKKTSSPTAEELAAEIEKLAAQVKKVADELMAGGGSETPPVPPKKAPRKRAPRKPPPEGTVYYSLCKMIRDSNGELTRDDLTVQYFQNSPADRIKLSSYLNSWLATVGREPASEGQYYMPLLITVCRS